MRFLRHYLLHAENGQAVAFFTIILVLILGATALAVDIGFFIHTRGVAQNAADSAALAGATELSGCGDQDPDPLTLAQDYAEKNLAGETFNSKPDSVGPMTYGSFDVDGVSFPTVSAFVERTQKYLFGQVFGLLETEIPAEAGAACLPGDQAAICPFYIQTPDVSQGPTSSTPFGLQTDEYVYKFKFAANEGHAGNRGFLDIYGSGQNEIRDGIAGGCVDPDDELDYVVTTEGDAISIDTQPGNSSAVFHAIDDLYSYEGQTEGGVAYESESYCDIDIDYDDFPEDAPFSYTLAVTDPDLAEKMIECGDDPDPTDNVHGRYWPILLTDSIVAQGCSGSCPITSDHLAIMYLACWGTRCDNSPGGHASIYGIFVTTEPFLPEHVKGISNNPLAPKQVVLVK